MAECPLAQVGTCSGVEGLRGNQRLLSEKRPKETKLKVSKAYLPSVQLLFSLQFIFFSCIEVLTENNEWAVWPGLTTNLTRASTGSPCSRSDPPFPPQWGWLCRGRSGTWCGSSVLMDTPKLKHNPREHPPARKEDMTSAGNRFSRLTLCVVRLYLHYHFFLAAHPRQPSLLGCGSLAHVLSETLHVFWAPRKVSSPTNNRAPGRLVLVPREKQYHTVSYLLHISARN